MPYHERLTGKGRSIDHCKSRDKGPEDSDATTSLLKSLKRLYTIRTTLFAYFCTFQCLVTRGQAETNAFNTLSQMLTTTNALDLPKPTLPYSVDTNASDYQIECSLFHTRQDGELKTIDYRCRSFQQAEKNYWVSEKECFAVVWALTVLRFYLQGIHFTVHTYHCCLRWLM